MPTHPNKNIQTDQSRKKSAGGTHAEDHWQHSKLNTAMANSLRTSSSPIKDALETSYPRILLLLSCLLNWQTIFSKCTGPGTEDFLCPLFFQTECSYERSKNRGTGINNAWELQVQEALFRPAANAQLSLAFAALWLDLLACVFQMVMRMAELRKTLYLWSHP